MTFSMVMHATLSIKHIHNILSPNALHLGIWEATAMQQKNYDPIKFPVSYISIYLDLSIYLCIYVSIYVSIYQCLSI